jgi:hypothetical protein
MDSVLVQYLNSGAAWLLVGSGPSIEMGYPTWAELATSAAGWVAVEKSQSASEPLLQSIAVADFPAVFEAAADALGMDRLLELLRAQMRPRKETGEIYRHIAKWPVAAYLTTNFDNELQHHLSKLGQSYETYSNSPHHLSLLVSDTSGVVVRLHGDLTGPDGLVLTKSQYRGLAEGAEFEYWRTRMTSLMQLQRVIVIGHSLTDPHVRMVLEAAKRGSAATREVCWIAPDVAPSVASEYLTRYRIRVVSYPSSSDHRGLLNLVRTVSQFVIPREGVRIRQSVAEVVQTGRRGNPAATAVYVFNRIAPHVDLSDIQAEVALAAVESVLPELRARPTFTIGDAFDAVGWPAEARTDALLNQAERALVKKGLVARSPIGLTINSHSATADQHRQAFNHLRSRFLRATEIRIKRDCAGIDDQAVQRIASDIDASLIGFFKQGGLTLATVLFASGRTRRPTIPSSVIEFIAEASAQYDDLASRQAFWIGSVGAFVDAGQPEREYLGRIAQGFFAFHAAGVFGHVAVERARNAKKTVWLIDSNLQIPALAIGSPSSSVYVDAFRRLATHGVRVFTTAKLFNETCTHLGFAQGVVRRHGADSSEALAAAIGDVPYRKQNLFLQGYFGWQQSGNPGGWDSYLHAAIGSRDPDATSVEAALRTLGIEVVEFQDWPGFTNTDFVASDACAEKLKAIMRRSRFVSEADDLSFEQWLSEKIPPEAEAAMIVLRERSGSYQILGTEPSPSWFISATSIVNALRESTQVTWQPEAFLAFVGTLVGDGSTTSYDHAFELVVWGIGRSGFNPVPESTIEAVFGTVTDQAIIEVSDQQEAMTAILGEKYSEKPEDVIRRLPPSRRMIAAIQMSNELVQRQQESLQLATAYGETEAKKARHAQTELDGLSKFRRRYRDRQALAAKRRRSSQTKGKPKKP